MNGLPIKLALVIFVAGWFSVGREKSGSGFPIRTEGKSSGFLDIPQYNKAAKKTKTINGMKSRNRFMQAP